MQAIFQNINENAFTLNGVPFYKLFLAIPLGSQVVKVVGIYESDNVIMPPTDVSNISVGGFVFENNIDLISALAPILFNGGDVGSGVGALINNQLLARFIDISNTPRTRPSFFRVVDAINAGPKFFVPLGSFMVAVAYYSINGQNIKQTWFLKNTGRPIEEDGFAYGGDSSNVNIGILEPNTKEVETPSNRTDFGDIGVTNNQAPEQHLRDFVNFQDAAVALIKNQLITATIDGVDYQWNFSGEDGEYGTGQDQTITQNFNRYDIGVAQDMNGLNNTLLVNGNPFTLVKHPNNSAASSVNTLEINDAVVNGWWTTTEFWLVSTYLGGDVDALESWRTLSTIEEIPIQ